MNRQYIYVNIDGYDYKVGLDVPFEINERNSKGVADNVMKSVEQAGIFSDFDYRQRFITKLDLDEAIERAEIAIAENNRAYQESRPISRPYPGQRFNADMHDKAQARLRGRLEALEDLREELV